MFRVLLAFTLAATAGAAPPGFEFTGSADPHGWQAAHDVAAFRSSSEGLVIPITGKDAYILSPTGDYRCPGTTLFTATLKSSAEGWGQIFFYKDNAAEDRALHFHIRAGWNDVAVPLPPMGEGWRLRLDLPAASGECILARAGVEEAGSR